MRAQEVSAKRLVGKAIQDHDEIHLGVEAHGVS